MQIILKSLFNSLIGFYVGISSIYWIPGIGLEEMRIFKISFFVLVLFFIAIVLPTLQEKKILSGIFGIPGIIILVLLYLPSIIISSDEYILFTIIGNCLSYYLFIWALFILSKNNLMDFGRITNIILLIISFFTIWHIIGSLFFNITIPNNRFWYVTFQDTAFNTSRTGWSNGLALFIPLCFVLRSNYRKWLFIALMIYSQFLTGGRSGLLASAFVILLYLVMSKAIGKAIFIFSLIGILIVSNINLVTKQLRIDALSGGITEESLNQFSSDRVVGNIYGIQQWLDSPFFGNGLRNVNIQKVAFVDEIHNFWIKTLAESGIFVCLFYILFIIILFINSYQIIGRQHYKLIFILVLISGIVETMFEPRVLFDAFQNSAVWWFGVAAILAYSHKEKKVII